MNSKSRFTKIAVSAGLIVTSGAAVLGLTGFASARLAPSESAQVVVQADASQDPAAQSVADDSNNSTDANAGSAGVTADNGTASAADLPTDGDHGPGMDDHGPRGGAPFAESVAKALGLTVTELRTQLQAGKSLADIAKAQNVDIQKVKDALIADITAHLAAEVKAGEHTQAEADKKLAEFTSRLDDMVNRVRPADGPGMGGKGGDHGRGGPAPFATDGLAKVLGLTSTELNTQLQAGKSLADIAKAQNVDISAVKDQLLKDYTDKEQAEVAAGDHTQAEVDAKIAAFKAGLDNMVNGVRPAGAPGQRGMGGDHGPGMGGRGGRHGHGPMGGDRDGDQGGSAQGQSSGTSA